MILKALFTLPKLETTQTSSSKWMRKPTTIQRDTTELKKEEVRATPRITAKHHSEFLNSQQSAYGVIPFM